MVDRLIGQWKSVQNENVDEYMKAINVNILLRKVGSRLTSYQEISRDGDTWSIKMSALIKSTTNVFNLDQPFTETLLDGRKMKSTFKVEEGKLICVQEAINPVDTPSTIVREVHPDGRLVMTLTATSKNITAKKIYVPSHS